MPSGLDFMALTIYIFLSTPWKLLAAMWLFVSALCEGLHPITQCDYYLTSIQSHYEGSIPSGAFDPPRQLYSPALIAAALPAFPCISSSEALWCPGLLPLALSAPIHSQNTPRSRLSLSIAPLIPLLPGVGGCVGGLLEGQVRSVREACLLKHSELVAASSPPSPRRSAAAAADGAVPPSSHPTLWELQVDRMQAIMGGRTAAAWLWPVWGPPRGLCSGLHAKKTS